MDRGLPVADIKDSLLAAVQLHPQLAVNPAPFVLFTDYGDKSLEFEVNLMMLRTPCANVQACGKPAGLRRPFAS